MELLDEIRSASQTVAARARNVSINRSVVPPYAASLPPANRVSPDGDVVPLGAPRDARAAFILCLDAINFGSGWFPTMRKRRGRSGFYTIALGLREQFEASGPWNAGALRSLQPAAVAATFRQDPAHELMQHFTVALRALGERVLSDHGGDFLALAELGSGSVEPLVERLAAWPSFADRSAYGSLSVPFFKRAQITASDLASAAVIAPPDLARLTLFADNLVPHVLRLDGVLAFDEALVSRIDRGDLLEHGSPEEVEIRAGALHAVELIAAARPDLDARAVDQLLWRRGQATHYKARPRHRSRCTAY